jgi:hypothetical protein
MQCTVRTYVLIYLIEYQLAQALRVHRYLLEPLCDSKPQPGIPSAAGTDPASASNGVSYEN